MAKLKGDGRFKRLRINSGQTNPTTGLVTIGAEEVERVEVYSQIGVLVARYTNEQVIDLGNLSSGIYVLRVTTPQGVAIRKVVKK